MPPTSFNSEKSSDDLAGPPANYLPTSAERGYLLVAEATAKELPPLNLADALDLTMLIARKEPHRHPRGADVSARSSSVEARDSL